jgi:hypothetical protein
MKKTKHTLPAYLSDKILRGVAFLNTDEDKQIIKEKLNFLETQENYTPKEISYILLLLSLPIVDKFFNEPKHMELAKQFQFGNVDNRTIN